jgi:hypothetical protein
MTAKLTVDESDVRTAHKVVWTVKAASVAILQRHLCLGYLRAGAILDELERRGIVGPAAAMSGMRRVMVAPEGCDAGSLPTPNRPAIGTDCECANWCEINHTHRLLTGHHEGCARSPAALDKALELIAALASGMDSWAADEDGIHPGSWDAYRRAKALQGVFLPAANNGMDGKAVRDE